MRFSALDCELLRPPVIRASYHSVSNQRICLVGWAGGSEVVNVGLRNYDDAHCAKIIMITIYREKMRSWDIICELSIITSAIVEFSAIRY